MYLTKAMPMSEEKKKAQKEKKEVPKPEVNAESASPEAGQELGEAEAFVAAAEAKAAELAAQTKELEDRYLRLAAEFDNFRKRTARDFQSVVKSANERLLLELLDLRDNFERALSNSAGNVESFRQGVELIAGQLDAILKKEGVEELEVDGRPFDPSTSEAIAHLKSERPEGEVLQVLAKGYSLGGRVIRPARVTVSKGEKMKSNEERNETAE
ncbi:MAG: nucleotide exchange factor GrpE [candidate division Zixibacteria bacterium]|nr:nucleotide exchange factor GrpE [candidate division Zixibacteria bacterium]